MANLNEQGLIDGAAEYAANIHKSASILGLRVSRLADTLLGADEERGVDVSSEVFGDGKVHSLLSVLTDVDNYMARLGYQVARLERLVNPASLATPTAEPKYAPRGELQERIRQHSDMINSRGEYRSDWNSMKTEPERE